MTLVTQGAGGIYDKVLVEMAIKALEGERIGVKNVLQTYVTRLCVTGSYNIVLGEWACDCAERVLHIFERHCPDDIRPRKAIHTMMRWLVGDASDEERYQDSAACKRCVTQSGASRGPFSSAAWYASRAALWAMNALPNPTYSPRGFEYAANAIACNTVQNGAIWDAKRDAAADVETRWQLQHLREMVEEHILGSSTP